MTAKTAWFYCGKCGFKNHPRPTAAPQFVPSSKTPGLYELQPGDVLCEQCGSHRAELGTDYDPGAQ